MTSPTPEYILSLKDQYVGKRIKLLAMQDDRVPVEPGSVGTCIGVDGAGSLLMDWDNGRRLSLIPCVDRFEVIN